jgi:hypothetical protein
MKQKTIYHLIVDQSGSMGDCIHSTINGFNEQVQKIYHLQKEFPEQEITIGLTTFNNFVNHHYFEHPPMVVKPLNTDTYRPMGSTALYDGIGETITNIESLLAEPSGLYDTTVVIVVITDGYENASRRFHLEDIKSRITRLEATGKWTFSFLGATLDAVNVAERMAFRRQNSAAFEKGMMQEDVFNRVTSGMKNYLFKKQEGKDLGNFYDKD